jgi:hypothetical protein
MMQSPAQAALVPVGTHLNPGQPIAQVGCGTGPYLFIDIAAPVTTCCAGY